MLANELSRSLVEETLEVTEVLNLGRNPGSSKSMELLLDTLKQINQILTRKPEFFSDIQRLNYLAIGEESNPSGQEIDPSEYVGLTDLKELLRFLEEEGIQKFIAFLDHKKGNKTKYSKNLDLEFMQQFFSNTLEKMKEIDSKCDEEFYDYE